LLLRWGGATPVEWTAALAVAIWLYLLLARYLLVVSPRGRVAVQELSGRVARPGRGAGGCRLGTLMLDHRLDVRRPRPAPRPRSAAEDLPQRKTREGLYAAGLLRLVCNTSLWRRRRGAPHPWRGGGARTARSGLCRPRRGPFAIKARLRLAKYGIVAPAKASLKKCAFMHPSEEVFAKPSGLYCGPGITSRAASHPVGQGRKVLEAFTPDFYLPEFDLYVELTTMKQSLSPGRITK